MTSAVARLFDAMADTYDDLEPWYEHLYDVLHTILRDTIGRAPSPAARAASSAPRSHTASLRLSFGISVASATSSSAERIRDSTCSLDACCHGSSSAFRYQSHPCENFSS